MAIVRLLPASTIADGPLTMVGGTTVHGILSDASDASYLEGQDTNYASGSARVKLGAHGIPSTARIVGVRFGYKASVATSGQEARTSIVIPVTYGTKAATVNTVTPTTFTEYIGTWYTESLETGAAWELDELGTLQFGPYISPSSSYDPGRVSEAFVEVEYNERPVGTLDPLGTVSTTSTPKSTWTYSDTEGDEQKSFRVVLKTGGVEVHDSGWVLSSVKEYQLPTLENSTTYTQELQVRQVWAGGGEHESAVSSDTFTVSLTAPDAPAVTVTEDPTQAKVTLAITDSPPDPTWSASTAYTVGNKVLPTTSNGHVYECTVAGTSGTTEPTWPTTAGATVTDGTVTWQEAGAPTPAAEWYTVQFRDAATDDWQTLRGAGTLTAAGETAVNVVDSECPFSALANRTYSVRSYTDASGLTIGSSATEDTATLATTGRWVTDALDSSLLNIEVGVSMQGTSWIGNEAVHQPAGLDYAVVESEPHVRQESVQVWALTAAEYTNVVNMLKSRRTLLYRDRRNHFYFRWVGTRMSSQVSKDTANVDTFSATMIVVARPST